MATQHHDDDDLSRNSTDELPRLSMDELVAPVVQQTVRDVLSEGYEHASKMFEAQSMCDHVLERFEETMVQSTTVNPPPPSAAVNRYIELLTQYVKFLKRFAGEKAVFRLVHNRVVVRENLQFHDDVDTLLSGFKFPQGNEVLENWRPRWNSIRDAQYAALKTVSRDKMLLLHKVDRQDAHTQTQALGLLLYEFNRVNSGYTPAELQLLTNAFTTVTQFSKNKAPTNETWFLPPYEVEISSAFAWGAYGKVHYGKFAGSDVAVKVMTIPEGVNRAAIVAAFVKEANIWFSASKFPNVVRLFGAYYDAKEPYFVSEFASNGTLRSYLRKEENLSQTWKLLHQVANGILALHKLGILHNDLKCDNVLVGADGVAKITDFGLCCQVSSLPLDATEEIAKKRLSEQEDVGAVPWKAPEILAKTSNPSFESDIYSLGMCIVEAVTHELPWGKMEPCVIRRFVKKGELPPRPASGFDDDQWALVEQMCAPDPTKRLPMEEAVALLYEFEIREANKKQRFQRRNSMLPQLTAVTETIGEEDESESTCGSDGGSQRSASPLLTANTTDLLSSETSTATVGSPVNQDASSIDPAIEVKDTSASASPRDDLAVASPLAESQQTNLALRISFEHSELGVHQLPTQQSASSPTPPPVTIDPAQPPALIPVVISERSVRPLGVVQTPEANSRTPHTSAAGNNGTSVPEPEEEPSNVPEPEPVCLVSATVKGSRYVTLEGSKKQVALYQVAIRLANDTEIRVWKRFSAFRNFRRRIRQLNSTQTSTTLAPFPSRFAVSGNMASSTVKTRRDSLRRFLESVVETTNVSFGVLVSENESYYNQGIEDDCLVVLL